jgi:hypothetical protein
MLEANDFVLVGASDRSLPKEVSQGDDLRKLGLGTEVLYWFGDDPELGTQTGQIPNGYLSKPLYKEWLRGVHSPGCFSFGPYVRLQGVGSFKVWFFIEVTNRGGAGEEVLTADITDTDNGLEIIASGTFKVSDFPAETNGYTIYSPNFSIRSNNRIESRIFAKGGASLKLWGIRWEVNAL